MNDAVRDKSEGPTSRRTVLQVAAWTIPAVAAVSAVPAFAASPSCEDLLATPGAYGPLTVDVEIVQVPTPNRAVTSSGTPHVTFAPGTPIKYRTTMTYNGTQPLPAGGQLVLGMSRNTTRDWVSSVTAIVSGAAYLGSVVSIQDLNDPYNVAQGQRATILYTLPEIPGGTTLSIEWDLLPLTSAAASGSYGHSRTNFPNPCDAAAPRIHRSIVAHGQEIVRPLPLGGTTANPDVRWIPNDNWATQP